MNREKKFPFFNLLCFALVFCSVASSTLNNIDKAYLEAKNLLANPGAESGRNDMTASAGTFTTTAVSANVWAGANAFSWDAGATGQTLQSGTKTLPVGGQCLVKTRYKTAESTVPYVLEAYDGTNVLGTATLTATTNFELATASFPCPTSGTVRWRARTSSSAGNPAIIYFDDLYLGADYTLSSVGQAQLAGQAYFETTASCTWSRSNATLGSAGTDADCPSPTVTAGYVGSWQTTDADLPRVTINNLPPGRYVATFSGRMLTAAATLGCIAVSDGTSTLGRSCIGTNSSAGIFTAVTATGVFEYTAAGNRSFEMYMAGSSGNLVQMDNNSTNERIQFTLLRFPISAETAFRADLVSQNWAGYHDTTCSFTRTNAAIGDFGTDASCAIAETKNINFGTVTVASGTLPGITWTPSKAGTWYVCAKPNLFVSTAMAIATARLTDGTTTIADVGYRPDTNGVNSATSNIPLCGLYSTSTSGTSITVKLQGSASSGDIAIASSGNTRSAIEWSIIDVTQSLPSPLLVGSVTSNTSGLERIERAVLNCDAGSAITSQSGTWVSSIGNIASGACSVTLTSGMFTSSPTCVASGSPSGSAEAIGVSVGSATLVTTKCSTDSGANCAAYDFNLICMGPR